MSKKTKRRILPFFFINIIHIHFYIFKFFVSSNNTIAPSFSTTSWKFSTTSNAVAFFTDMTSGFHYFFSILQYFNIVHIKYLSLIHISEPTRLGMISYAVFCLKKKKKNK